MGQHVNTSGMCAGEGNPGCDCGRYGQHRCEREEAWAAAIGSGKLIIPDALPDLPPPVLEELMEAMLWDAVSGRCEARGYFSPENLHLHCEKRTHAMSEPHEMWSRGGDEPSTLIRWKDGRVVPEDEPEPDGDIWYGEGMGYP